MCQVSDWEEGGRTSSEHAERIFCKERAEDPHAVHAVLHRYSVASIVSMGCSALRTARTHSMCYQRPGVPSARSSARFGYLSL